ncbi:hypothetical protein B0H11DRAFT_2250528 [Mycena galericulata]|nr:hypothetical protein B0H11DRAFT_2250528 [Mycena galericulata]
MDAKTILVNNSSLFPPTSSLPAFPSLLPVSSYRHSQTYSTLTATPLRVQQVVLIPLTGGGRQSSPSGLPRVMPPTREVWSSSCLLPVQCTRPASRERITHAPVSLGYTREHNTICHRGHAKISGVILIPEPEHERRHRRHPRQLLPQQYVAPFALITTDSAHGGRLLHGVWARDAHARPVPMHAAHMAIPTVRDLRHAPQIPSRELDITYFLDSTVLTYPEVAPSRRFPINTVCRRVVSLVL